MQQEVAGWHGLDPVAALAEARYRPPPPAMPPARLGVRLKTSRVRGLIPTRLVVRRAERRGRAICQKSTAAREDALAVIETIIGATRSHSELAELAQQHLIEVEVERALFWQRWLRPRKDATATANLKQALGSGRGVLVSVCHQGPMGRGHAAITSPQRTLYSTSARWFFEEPSHDHWGRRLARWRRELYARNQRALPSLGAFTVLQLLLEAGELVLIQFDVPGSRETRFLGKPVMLTAGTARLAVQADALVLPMRSRRVAHRVWVDIEAPLDPRDFADDQALHETLAAVHERWILESPASLEDPRREGAWEAGATAAAWIRPEEVAQP
jgi:lauroyl/myristoyl acyltransferase